MSIAVLEVEEVVYSREMSDPELEKLLGKIGQRISEAIKASPSSTPASRLTTTQTLIGIVVSVLVVVGSVWAGLTTS